MLKQLFWLCHFILSVRYLFVLHASIFHTYGCHTIIMVMILYMNYCICINQIYPLIIPILYNTLFNIYIYIYV